MFLSSDSRRHKGIQGTRSDFNLLTSCFISSVPDLGKSANACQSVGFVMRKLVYRSVSAIVAMTMALPVLVTIAPDTAGAQQTASINRGPSGLPLPRFVSLKSERVNMRVGPGKDYAVAWLYTKSGLPLEIIQEWDNWRRVRDADGTIGWIHGSLLSGERTAIATPWKQGAKDETISLYDQPRAGARTVAYLQPGVVANLNSCDGAWCEVAVDANGRSLVGFASQADLWGAYPDEKIED
mgnify:FL=1